MKAPRERQERFMNDFGRKGQATAEAVLQMLCRHGAAWLTDEQMAQIVSWQVRRWRFTERLSRRNRNRRIAS